jgi:hypothetical protein
MAKKLMIDEAHRFPSFIRIVVTYKCGCSYYNDSWKAVCESEPLCEKHGKPIRSNLTEHAPGVQPEKTETKPHSLKLTPME